MTSKEPAEKAVRDIRRRTRRRYSCEAKIRIVLEGLRGEESIAALCRREGIAQGLYYIYGRLSRCKPMSIWSAWSVANIYPASPGQGWGAQMGNPLTQTSTAGRPRRPL